MKAKHAELASRHPKVVMVYENADDIAGAATIISEQIDEYRTIILNDKTAKFLITTKPAVILFALEDITKAIHIYSQLVEEEQVNHPHYSIVMCSNRESGLAFRCCIKGLFDNYFVYQPLYEKFRLKIMIHNGIRRGLSNDQYLGVQKENFDEIDEKLAELIDQSAECKQKLLNRIEASKDEILKATDEIETKEFVPQVSPKEIMGVINEEHVKPLLASLEQDIKSGLDTLVEQLVAQKIAQQAHDKQIKAISKVKLGKVEDVINVAAKQEKDKTPTVESKAVPKKSKIPKVLIVEDNLMYRDMLVNVLRKEKYDVEEAEDGLKAIQKIKKDSFDLILMDLYMPKLDGINATKQIRLVNGGKKIPIIALTGNKDKTIVRKWASFGLKGYIVKPSTKQEILDTVNKVLN